MSNLNYNKVIESGRITARPELKTTPNGISVTTFSIAVKRQKTSSNEEISDFFTCTAWRQTAEFITRYFDKGSAILVDGKLQTRSWTDQSGQKRYATEILVENAFFVDSKSDNVYAPTPANAPTSTPPAASQTYMPSAYTQSAPAYEPLKDDEDLPF